MFIENRRAKRAPQRRAMYRHRFSSTRAGDEHCTPLGCGRAKAHLYKHRTPLGCLDIARFLHIRCIPITFSDLNHL